MKIAILGASGHVGKTLLHELSAIDSVEAYAFLRRPDVIINDRRLPEHAKQHVYHIDSFSSCQCDAVVNCIGMGDPSLIKDRPIDLFLLTEKYDELIMEYLTGHEDCVAVNISSGAVYGSDFATPADSSTVLSIPVNQIAQSSYYTIAKLNAEAKHRAASNLIIADVRLFSYFSQYISLEMNYFMVDVVNAIRTGSQLKTSSDNIIRDYIHPKDFAQLIFLVICNRMNMVVDAYSLQPVSKFEILDFVKSKYMMNYHNAEVSASATGEKNQYYSINKKAGELGYIPQFTSLDSIIYGLTGLICE